MPTIRRHYPPFVLAVLILLVGASLVFKTAAAAPTWIHYDENYYLDISRSFIARGELTPYMWRLGDTNIIAGSGSGYGILLLTAWMQGVGPSLFNGRLLMIAVGLVTAGVLYVAARRWWNSEAAGVGALLFAMVGISPFYNLILRMDAPGALAYALVLLLHITAMRTQSRWLHAATGAAAVFAAELHILALLYLGALAFYYAADFAWTLLRERRLSLRHPAFAFGAAALAAGLLYVLIHVVPDPRAYFIISERCLDCTGRSFDKELARFAGFAVLRLPELILLLLALGAALWRRRRDDVHYIVLVIGFLIAQAVIAPPAFVHYTAHIWPLTAIGVGGLAARLAPADGRQTWRWAPILGVAGLLLAWDITLSQTDAQPFELRLGVAPGSAATYVRTHIPTDTVIMGDVTDYYALQDYGEFLSYRNGDQYGTALRGETQLEFWQRVRPQVILLQAGLPDDPELRAYMDEVGFTNIMPGLWVAGQGVAAGQDGGLSTTEGQRQILPAKAGSLQL